MARLGETRHGGARHGMAAKAGLGLAGSGATWHGMAGHGRQETHDPTSGEVRWDERSAKPQFSLYNPIRLVHDPDHSIPL